MMCNTMHTSHDAFRFRGLNKSSAEVLQVLKDGPKSVGELATLTGRHRTTILDPKNSGFNAMASHFDTENVVSVRQTTHYQILDNPSIVWYNITS